MRMFRQESVSRRARRGVATVLLGLAWNVSAGEMTSKPSRTLRFIDNFRIIDHRLWKFEYTAPTASGGRAMFRLKAGVPPDHSGAWSKIVYKRQRFTSGSFKVRFALSGRPRQAVWWGAALWDDGKAGKFNEINFGYTTDQSFTNSQLLFESARMGRAKSVKVDVGVDLYDDTFHEAELKYNRHRVSLYFDGRLMRTITNKACIPTAPMEFLIGPRLVTGSSPLNLDFVQTVDRTEISKVSRPRP